MVMLTFEIPNVAFTPQSYQVTRTKAMQFEEILDRRDPEFVVLLVVVDEIKSKFRPEASSMTGILDLGLSRLARSKIGKKPDLACALGTKKPAWLPESPTSFLVSFLLNDCMPKPIKWG